MTRKRISIWTQCRHAARLAAIAIVCSSLTACATLDSFQPQASPGQASAPAAAAGELAAPVVAPRSQTPAAPLQQPTEHLDMHSRVSPPAGNPYGIALASHHEPATPQGQPHANPTPAVANAHYQATVGSNSSNGVSQAVHRADPRQPYGQVQQVNWNQCPSCAPVLPSGTECFSLDYDNHAPLRYRDEYICDGGDMPLAVQLDKRMKAHGLNLEDTVAHYVTEKGTVVVEPSTRTCIYAPRFAAVRQIQPLAINEHSSNTGMTGFVALPTLSQNQDVPTNLHQPLELEVSSGAAKLHVNRARNRGVPETGVTALLELDRDLLPFENLNFVRRGIMLNSEKALLTRTAQNAVTWTGDLAVQAILDETPAVVAAAATGPDSTHEYVTPDGKPRLRVLKLADRDNAHPSDEVNFTLRFDNIGDQKINEVVLLDNLSGRLEYVEGSSESSVPAKFSTELNEGESLTLRWELEEPLDVGEGGVIRFKCKVR